MSLKDAIKIKNKKNNNSSKNPAYYNKKKNDCLKELASHEEKSVRLAFANSQLSPAKIVTERLSEEQDFEVLRAILMNENLSKKKLFEFAAKDERAEYFDDDEELIQYIESLQVDEDDDEEE